MNIIDWFAFGLILCTATGIILSRNWRWSIVFLVGQYLSYFWLVQISWNFSHASVKLVAGWMICAILGLAHRNVEEEQSGISWPQGRLFQLIVICLVLAVAYAGGVPLANWLGLNLPAAWGGLFLIGMGLIHTGITLQPFRVILGLLTSLSGFEVLYASVERSALVTGLLVLVNLGLAMAGAYFLTQQVEKAEQ